MDEDIGHMVYGEPSGRRNPEIGTCESVCQVASLALAARSSPSREVSMTR